MKYLHLVTTFLLIAAWSVQANDPPHSFDACKTGEYTVLNQTYRNTGYDLRAGEQPKCDSPFRKGWYKVVAPNGTPLQIATSCPGSNTCGTTIPIWMKGAHPNREEDVVSNTLCGKDVQNGTDDQCCNYKDEVFVQKCKDFYIYYLTAVWHCSASYCFGNAKRCPPRKWSDTDLEPCKNLSPVMINMPHAVGPNVDSNQRFNFQCQIMSNETDPRQVYEVEWTFNGQLHPPIQKQVLRGSERVATLLGHQLKNFTDGSIGCWVTAYFVGRETSQVRYHGHFNYFGIKKVVLTGPSLNGNTSFSFTCEVSHPSDDPNQRVEIIWTFDGQQDPNIKPTIVTGSRDEVLKGHLDPSLETVWIFDNQPDPKIQVYKKEAILDGSALKGHFNTNVGCQARLIFEGDNVKTKFVASSTYFAGIKVSHNGLDISATDKQTDVTITSTIPMLCDDNSQPCCLTFKTFTNTSSVVSLKDGCDKKMCSTDWNDAIKTASVTISVVPLRNTFGGVTHSAVLSFEGIVLTGRGKYIDIFSGHKANPIPVSVKVEAGSTCSITGDPHFRGFDLPVDYHLYQSGDYTAVWIKERDFLFQIRTFPCSKSATCVCGFVIKERNNIIRVDGCKAPTNLIQSTKIDIPYNLSTGAVVQKSPSGNRVAVFLPSGSEITTDIASYYYNVYIKILAIDKNKAVGLCGTNDGNKENDFTKPNGQVVPQCRGRGNCIPVEFTESWRVNGNDSMFVTTPPLIQEQPPAEYCSCIVNSLGKSEFSCSPRKHIPDNKIACPGCKIITDELKPNPWGKPDEKPYVHAPVKPVDPNKNWPNDGGVTENQAREKCNEAIRKSPLYSRCQNTANLVDRTMEDCLGDILFGNTLEYLNSATSSYTTNCQQELAKDKNNYKKEDNGKLTLIPEVSNICPPECKNHGKCGDDQKCQCEAGWGGEACQIEVPQITRPEGTVYVCEKPCNSVKFTVSKVSNSQKLTCRVQQFNEGMKIGKPVDLSAVATGTEVTCPLPEIDTSLTKFVVTVSPGGNVYSNGYPVWVFDPICLDCCEEGCILKETACYIKDVCYGNHELNKCNNTQKCDVSKSLTRWSD